MKPIQARHDLFLLVATPLAIIGILLYWLIPDFLTKAYCIYWLPLIVIIFLALIPWGKQRLSSEDSKTSATRWTSWLSKIFGLQIGLFALYYSISALATKIFPVVNKMDQHAFTITLQHMFINYGLLPWSVFTLIAVSLGYYAFRDQQDAYFSVTTSNLLPSQPNRPWGLAFNTLAKQSTITVLGLTLALLALVVANLFTSSSFHIVHGVNQSTAIASVILVVLVFIKPTKRYIGKIFNVKVSMVISYLVSIITLAILLLFLSFMLKNPTLSTGFKTPALLQNLLNKDPQTVWIIFSVSWWLAWTPVMAAFIARFSREYSVRSVILGSMLFPIILTVVVFLLFHYQIHFLTHNPYIAAVIGLAGFLLFFSIICKRDTLSMLLLSYLPKDQQIKHRDHHFFARRTIQMAVIFFYVYLPGGIYFTTPFLFLVILPASLIPLLSSVNLLKKSSFSRWFHFRHQKT